MCVLCLCPWCAGEQLQVDQDTTPSLPADLAVQLYRLLHTTLHEHALTRHAAYLLLQAVAARPLTLYR